MFEKPMAKIAFVIYNAVPVRKNLVSARRPPCGTGKSEKRKSFQSPNLSQKETVSKEGRVCGAPEPVRRIHKRAGQHGKRFHHEKVQEVAARNLQADERHGFVKEKPHPSWEAERRDNELQLWRSAWQIHFFPKPRSSSHLLTHHRVADNLT